MDLRDRLSLEDTADDYVVMWLSGFRWIDSHWPSDRGGP